MKLKSLLVILFVVLTTVACSNKYYYVKGLKAAQHPTSASIYNGLTEVTTSNKDLVWQTINGKQYILAVTWKAGMDEKLMDVSVPAAEEGKDRKQTSVGEIIINVKNDGAIVVNGQTLNVDELLGKLQNIATVYKDQAVIIRGDTKTEYDKIIKVLDTCQKAGIWNIAFATRDPKDAPPPK
jgi:biopolymer transport protein ExbD